jgi:sarcosine oxidase subunit alpha
MQHLEYARQVLWPALDVQIASVTDQWSQYAIAGPSARELLELLFDKTLDLSNDAFPYLACGELDWDGIPARLFRISFSGELGYELAVPSMYGNAALLALMRAGESLGVAPYGTEALGTLRIEKGHASAAELNGTTTADDLGLGRMMSSKKSFIGSVLAKRPGLTNPNRMKLIGVRPVDRSQTLRAGAHLLPLGAPHSHDADQGYLTSATQSPTLGYSIALGFLKRGPERLGEHLRACDPLRNSDVEVEVVAPVFHDPDGARLRT